ncbi:MAG: hypothetical protein AUH29_02420 [Candidatus Rokubacteria bacterium 13_1_40CM_69_27]|nr:MAG: hypothetical protein AUH29_02420 [Candidatus Rokubacteria bacterium 13_1_40CM_69_27]
MLNAKIPVKAWSVNTAASRRFMAGRPRSRKSRSGSRIGEASAKRRPATRSTGSVATTIFPTTTELPTMAMAALSSRYARNAGAGTDRLGARSRA